MRRWVLANSRLIGLVLSLEGRIFLQWIYIIYTKYEDYIIMI